MNVFWHERWRFSRLVLGGQMVTKLVAIIFCHYFTFSYRISVQKKKPEANRLFPNACGIIKTSDRNLTDA